MLCLRCFHLWPAGSAYCGVCRLPINARKCPSGHSNPLTRSQQTCLACNQGPLTSAVLALPMTALHRIAALMLLLLCWRWTWDRRCLVLYAMWQAGVWGVSVAFDTTPDAVTGGLARLLAWIALLLALSYLLPNGRGTFLRGWLRSGARMAARAVRLAWAALRRLL